MEKKTHSKPMTEILREEHDGERLFAKSKN